MSASSWSLVICFEPTTAASPEARLAVDVPPQPAATSASVVSASRRRRLMEKAPFAAVSSRCLARGQYSIDEPKCLGKTLFAQAHLAVGNRVDRGVHASAQVAELVGAEHHLAHACLPAAENEVVCSGAGELELRLLDQEQIFDRIRQRP